MPRRSGQPEDRGALSRYIGELSRVVVISTSVLATIAAVVLLILVILTFLGIA